MTHKNYRCCLTDRENRTLKTERVDAADDASALLQVERLLERSPHGSAELWDGQRLVGKWAAAARAGMNGQSFAAAPAA